MTNTGTDIVNRDPRDVISGEKIQSIIPQDFASVYRFAELISLSSLAPKDMRDAATIAVAIMHGFEVGLSPMMALQSIAVINGRPSLWGDGAMALIRSHPSFEYIKEFSEGVYGEPSYTAVCLLKRKGHDEIRSEFSWAEASDARLLDKSGPWKEYRRRMFKMRARAFALRDLFPDVLRGLSIAEEMNDVSPAKTGIAIGDAPAPDEDGTVVAQTTKAKAEPRKKADAKPKEDGIDKANAEDATVIPGDDGSKGGAEDNSATENSEADTSNAADDLNPPAPDDDVADEAKGNDNKQDDFKGKIEEARQKSAEIKSLIPELPEGTAASVVKWFADHNRIWAKAKTLEEFRSVWSSRATIALSEEETELVKAMRDNHKKRIEAEIQQAANKETPPVPEGSEFDYPEFKAVFEEGLAKCKMPDDVNRLASDLHAPPLSDALTAGNQEELKELVLARMDQLESFDK